MRRYRKLFLLILTIIPLSLSFGQQITGERPDPCTENPRHSGKYEILSISNGDELQIYLEIKAKNRIDENYIAIAKEFRERFCQQKELRIVFLTGKKQWLILNPRNPDATPLAIYYFNEDPGKKEGLVAYKVVNTVIQSRQIPLK